MFQRRGLGQSVSTLLVFFVCFPPQGSSLSLCCSSGLERHITCLFFLVLFGSKARLTLFGSGVGFWSSKPCHIIILSCLSTTVSLVSVEQLHLTAGICRQLMDIHLIVCNLHDLEFEGTFTMLSRRRTEELIPNTEIETCPRDWLYFG